MDSLDLCYVVLVLYVIMYQNDIKIAHFSSILSNSFANTTFFALKFGILYIYIYIYLFIALSNDCRVLLRILFSSINLPLASCISL